MTKLIRRFLWIIAGLMSFAAIGLAFLAFVRIPIDLTAHKDILEPGVGFLHKPYSPEMLIRKVHDLLTGIKSQAT